MEPNPILHVVSGYGTRSFVRFEQPSERLELPESSSQLGALMYYVRKDPLSMVVYVADRGAPEAPLEEFEIYTQALDGSLSKTEHKIGRDTVDLVRRDAATQEDIKAFLASLRLTHTVHGTESR